MSAPLRWTIPPEESGQRLDRFLARCLDKPRNQVQKWIAEERVRIDGRPAKASAQLAAGNVVECDPPAAREDAGLEPERGPLAVLYEDSDLIVLDKAAGVAVHPGAGLDRGTLAHFLLHRYPEIATVGGAGRPGIVHRLDKGTSGLLLAARSEGAYQALSTAFAARAVRKSYLAIAYGTPRATAGDIDLPIGRHPHDRKRMDVRHRGGRPALSRYRCRRSAGGVSLFEIDLATGRTHQIRVHLKAIGHPLVGDPTYGEERWRGLPRPHRDVLRRFPRPALHAWRLQLAHPADGRELTFEAPVPTDLRELWRGATGEEWPAN